MYDIIYIDMCHCVCVLVCSVFYYCYKALLRKYYYLIDFVSVSLQCFEYVRHCHEANNIGSGSRSGTYASFHEGAEINGRVRHDLALQ